MLISVYVYMNMRITMVMLLRHTGPVSIQQRGSRSSRKSAHVRRNVCATRRPSYIILAVRALISVNCTAAHFAVFRLFSPLLTTVDLTSRSRKRFVCLMLSWSRLSVACLWTCLFDHSWLYAALLRWVPVAVFFDVRFLAASRFAGIATGVFHCKN